MTVIGYWIARSSRAIIAVWMLRRLRQLPSSQLHGPVIIAMIAMRMVQPTVHEIVDVVAVRHLFVSAVRAVGVRAVNFRRAVLGICRVDRDGVFVDVILVHMVKMAVVKIIHMAVMANRGVAAFRTVLVGVIGMMLLGAGRHGRVLSSLEPVRTVGRCSPHAKNMGAIML
jgi:hypothetical protein